MTWLRSLLFALLFYPGTLVYVLSILAATPFGPRGVRYLVRGWSVFHFALVRHLLRIEVRWEGEIPPGPYLIAAKHSSMMEAVDALRWSQIPVVVMKRELSEVPLWGRVALTYGIIPVDREAGAKALRTLLTAGRAAVAAGRPVIIFPEGTRVRPGTTPPLRPGFAGLYRTLGLPVVPIAHNVGTLWGRGLIHRSGIATFRVGEIIPAGLPRDEIEARVHAAINQFETGGTTPAA